MYLRLIRNFNTVRLAAFITHLESKAAILKCIPKSLNSP